MTQPMIIDQPWEANRAACPFDFDLADFLANLPRSRSLTAPLRRVFHMGTGMHHHVGLRVAREQMPFSVVGLTATPDEMGEWVRMAVTEPQLTHRYTVLFGDIFTMRPEFTLSPLDIVSLPHLGEFVDRRRAEYGGAPEEVVIARFHKALAPGGFFVVYPGSVGYGHSRHMIDALVSADALRDYQTFGSLRVLQKPQAPR